MSRLKCAELTSGIGALVLGVGLGALFPEWFSPSAGLIVFAGVATHAFGMWDNHRREAQAGAELFYAYMVDNQAIVIPETIDAIRALTGTVRDANESIAMTNAALGIEASLIGAAAREPVHP